MENLKNVFINFINKVPFYGFSVLCADDFNIKSIMGSLTKKYITYGLKAKADITAKNIRTLKFGSSFDLIFKGKKAGRINLNVPGLHNILNALAVSGASLELGLSFSKVKKGLQKFTGVHRRFEKIGEAKGIIVVDDYGHHPTEIKATLLAAKAVKAKRIVAVFQPHRYSRSKLLYEKFGTAFKNADVVVLTDIYPAGEKPLPNVSGELIYNAIKKNHKKTVFIKDKNVIPEYLLKAVKKGDLVITLGAGDIRKYGEEFYARIK
jgi:UDP-N-acetylmuramate--alanine ligase